jgi:hypothetical protein
LGFRPDEKSDLRVAFLMEYGLITAIFVAVIA